MSVPLISRGANEATTCSCTQHYNIIHCHVIFCDNIYYMYMYDTTMYKYPFWTPKSTRYTNQQRGRSVTRETTQTGDSSINKQINVGLRDIYIYIYETMHTGRGKTSMIILHHGPENQRTDTSISTLTKGAQIMRSTCSPHYHHHCAGGAPL